LLQVALGDAVMFEEETGFIFVRLLLVSGMHGV
jgi:hypothetical protein